MRRVQPAFALVLLLAVQSLCVIPGLGGQTPATVTPPPSSEVTETPASGISTSPGEVTEAPPAESVGTINLVISQVQSGPPESLQYLEGIQDFHNGDGVRVTEGGKGKLDLDDGTQLTLFNETQVSGVNVSTSPPEADLFLQNQGFLGEVPTGGYTTVQMPNGAKILILGTHFFVLYNSATQVATAGNFDGLVLYIPPGGPEQELSPGRMVNIPPQGAVELMELPFTPEQFEGAADNATTPIGGLTALVQEYQIEPIVFIGQQVAIITYDSYASSAVFSPDGRYVLSGGCDDASDGCQQGSARVLDFATGTEVGHMDHADTVMAVAFSPDGKYAVSGSGDGTAIVWDAFTGQQVTHISHDQQVYDVAFSPDGRLVVSGGVDGTARVWEALTGGEVARITYDEPDSVSSVAFSPDGRYVVSGGGSTARVWDLSTRSEFARMTHGINAYSVAFSPDGRYAASGGCDDGGQFCVRGTVHVLDLSTRGEVASITHQGWVFSVAFSPDSKYIVSGSSGKGGDGPDEGVTGSILVSEASTGQEVTPIELDSWARSVAFSPDGNYVVSGTDDGAVRVWDAFTGREVAHMSHDDSVNIVAFSPDGKYVLSGSADGTARVWLWQPE